MLTHVSGGRKYGGQREGLADTWRRGLFQALGSGFIAWLLTVWAIGLLMPFLAPPSTQPDEWLPLFGLGTPIVVGALVAIFVYQRPPRGGDARN
jgi:hypothetical protein